VLLHRLQRGPVQQDGPQGAEQLKTPAGPAGGGIDAGGAAVRLI
jgi:hypothetical protein